MAGDTTSEPIAPGGKIEFIQFHKPPMIPGEYRITVTQEINIGGDQKPGFVATRNFLVFGERFELKPEDIYAVFPPEGSLGDHSNVLPHVALNRSTLPWERKPWGASGSGDAPWLILLLFDQEEQPETQVTTLGEIKGGMNGRIKFPAFTLEASQQDADKVAVIDVKKSVLQDIMPAPRDLPFMAHVRQTKDAAGNPDAEERAVIIGHRLPRRGALSTVHLVSVEGRYTSDGFDYQGAGDEDSIRLISLKSWRFACANETQSFKGLLVNLNGTPSALRLPPMRPEKRLAEDYLSQGYAPLPHRMRQGEQTVSWYHGPFIPVQNAVETPLPARSADELARYDTEVGLFDVSYAAAWELGRLLALQSKSFSVGLYHWKRAHAQCLKQDEQRLLHPHLPTSESAPEEHPLPEALAKWFRDLSELRGVPFNYLVPDERMLPPESIRFFRLDAAWVDCLLDGAFSVGRVTSAAHAQDQAHEVSPASNPHACVSGFLLRSDVVSGWPALVVDAYDGEPNRDKLESVRMDRLSDNVLLCMFAGEARIVEIHQRPEALHFGLDETADVPPNYSKKLRDSQGVESQSTEAEVPIPWSQAGKRTIDIYGLAQAIENILNDQTPMTSAQLALQMIEGVEKVVFQAGEPEEAKAAAVSATG